MAYPTQNTQWCTSIRSRKSRVSGAADWWQGRGRQPEDWIGVGVDDVDAICSRVTAAGVHTQPPESKFCGVRVLQVQDLEGYTWGFMERGPFVARAPVSQKQ